MIIQNLKNPITAKKLVEIVTLMCLTKKVRSLIFMGLTKHYRAAYSGQLTVIRMRVIHYK